MEVIVQEPSSIPHALIWTLVEQTFQNKTGRPRLKWHSTYFKWKHSHFTLQLWEFPESPSAASGLPCLSVQAKSNTHVKQTEFEICALYKNHLSQDHNPALDVWSKWRKTPASRTQQAAWRIIFISGAQRMLFCLAFPA